MRSVPTIVAMAVAVGAVVSLVGISSGFEDSFMDLYRSAGIDIVVVRAGVQERINSTLDAKLAKDIRKGSRRPHRGAVADGHDFVRRVSALHRADPCGPARARCSII